MSARSAALLYVNYDRYSMMCGIEVIYSVCLQTAYNLIESKLACLRIRKIRIISFADIFPRCLAI